MLISVIIPFYNMEDFLEEAIISVINQSYTNWELLLIDDGSTDRSTSIALHYASASPLKIKYLIHDNQSNKGLTCSRNLGLKVANGDYVALLDADDFWLHEKLATQVTIAQTYPECALIAGPSIYWCSWNDPSIEDVEIQVGKILDQIIKPPNLVLHLYPIGENAAPCPSSLMIKTEILKKHNGFEEEFEGIYQMYEDQAFLSKLYLHEECYISSNSHSKYRQRPNSLVSSVTKNGKYRKVRGFYLKWFKNYIKDQNIQNDLIHQALKTGILENKYPFIARNMKWIAAIFEK